MKIFRIFIILLLITNFSDLKSDEKSDILKNKILKNNGIIIIHRHKKETDIFPENFRIIDEKKYGISKIIFGSYF